MAIGEIKLVKLQSHHLQEFYNNLRENGIKQVGSYATSQDLRSIMKQKKLTQKKLSELSGISPTTISSACKENGHISIESAEKIAAALKMPLTKVFKIQKESEA